MSYPYPQDREREKREKVQQPYKDARETLNQNEVELETEAIAYGEAHQEESSDERRARLEAEMEKRFAKINQEVVERTDEQAGGRKTTRGEG